MFQQYITDTALFFLAILLEYSLAPIIHIAGITPSFIFILFFLMIFFTDQSVTYEGYWKQSLQSLWLQYSGWSKALLAGFFLDLTSPFAFGIYMIIFLVLYFFIYASKYFLRGVSHEFEQQPVSFMIYFLVFFTITFFVYNLATFFIFKIPILHFDYRLLVYGLYHLCVAGIFFMVYKQWFWRHRDRKQLRLL